MPMFLLSLTHIILIDYKTSYYLLLAYSYVR